EVYDNLELYLLEGKDYPKQVAMFRKMGMRIFDKKHFRGATSFVGVFCASGDDVNEKLSEMEPVAHDKWESSRSQDYDCLIYTSDAADEDACVDIGGRSIIK
ncbi:hypothetical protein KQJ29_30480, partial [Enterococcus sp. S181_ASV_20]|nr:hypothetical protein [Enterococcus sp. S181_ASV_20]